MEGGQQRPMTMSEEGIVHFSVPARVPGKFALAGGGAPDAGVGEGGGDGMETGVVFAAELWQVVNRSRRVRGSPFASAFVSLLLLLQLLLLLLLVLSCCLCCYCPLQWWRPERQYRSSRLRCLQQCRW